MQNQYLYAAGMTATANEIVEDFERETGKKFEVGRADVAQCVREAERRLDQGFPDAGMFLMERTVMYDTELDAVGAFEENDAKGKLGLEKERLKDVIHDVLHELQHHGGGGGCGCD